MALLMTVATLWGVAQLTVLASWSRTLRFSTLLLVVAFGGYACGPTSVLLQWGWTRAYSAVTHTPLGMVVDTAAYTVDPVVEEVVKALPLVLVGLLLARVSRQLGFTDHLLVGAATGAGFSLFESLLRFGTVKALSMSLGDGYLVQASLGGAAVVPGVGTTLRSWLPEPTSTEALLGPATSGVTHLGWTALAAAGVGWFWRRSGPVRWWGAAPLVFACVDHLLYNYVVVSSTVPSLLVPVNAVVSWLHHRLGLVVLLALVAAVALDRITQSAGRETHPEVLLRSEPPDGLVLRPLWSFARLAPPWTAMIADRFALTRRAALYATELAPADTGLVGLVAETRAQMDRARDPLRWTQVTRATPRDPRAMLGVVGRLLRDWRVVVWMLLLLPAVLYLVVGGFPATRGLQEVFRSTAGGWVLIACTVAGGALLMWQVVAMARVRGTALALPVGEQVGRYLARLAVGVGAVAAGLVLVVAGTVGGRPGNRTLITNLHALDALGSLLIVLGLALFLFGLFMFPPFALAATTLGTLVLVPTVSGAVVLTTAGAAVLGGIGVYLNEAADGGGYSGGSGSGPAPPSRAQRLEELARDPAHGGRIDDASRAEAEAGLGLEEQGVLEGPITRSAHPGEEFIDAKGQAWDVKAFRSAVPGGRGAFRLDEAVGKVTRETRLGENVIVDTRGLDVADSAALKEAIGRVSELIGRVVFWP